MQLLSVKILFICLYAFIFISALSEQICLNDPYTPVKCQYGNTHLGFPFVCIFVFLCAPTLPRFDISIMALHGWAQFLLCLKEL